MSWQTQPSAFIRYAFSGQVDTNAAVLGRSGDTGVTLTIPMAADHIPIYWYVKNDNASNGTNLWYRFGPSTGTFDAASGAALATYAVLKPGEAYSPRNRLYLQEVSTASTSIGGVSTTISVVDKYLLLRAASSTADFSGWVDCWIATQVS